MNLWNQRVVVCRRPFRAPLTANRPLSKINFSIDVSCPIFICYFIFESRERSHLTYHKSIKVGFYIILRLPHSIMDPQRSTYARCSNSVFLHFYNIIPLENMFWPLNAEGNRGFFHFWFQPGAYFSTNGRESRKFIENDFLTFEPERKQCFLTFDTDQDYEFSTNRHESRKS